MHRWIWILIAVGSLGGAGTLLRRQGTPARPTTTVARTNKLVVYAAQDLSTATQAFSLDIFTMNSDGSGQKNLTHSQAAECDPALSPDGTRIAFALLVGEKKDAVGLYTMSIDGSDRRQVTSAKTVACSPSWSPDGLQIAFTHVTWKVGEQVRLDYDAQVELISTSGGSARKLVAGWNPVWSPDGKQILFTGVDGSLCLIPAVGGPSRVLVKATKDDGIITGSWSPDGRKIVGAPAYDKEQFLVNADGSGRRQLPKGSSIGTAPHWSADGKWLFYTRQGNLEDSISEVWRMDAQGRQPQRLVAGKAFTGGFGRLMIGMGGIGREEVAEQQPPQGPTVSGTEEAGLISRLHGTLITQNEARALEAISLPGLQRRTIVSPTVVGPDSDAAIYYYAGPDRKGRVVYVENYISTPPAKSHFTLNVIHLDGTGKRVLFDRPGDALWDHAIGENLALSADGKVAFASDLKNAQMPGALLQTGTLEIWDLEKESAQATKVTVLDDGFSWFPDGRQLAYVQLAPRADAGDLPQKPDQLGAEFAKWPTIPTTFVLDTVTGKSRRLHPGWNATVSAEGTSVVVADLRQRLRQVDVKTGNSTPLELPGYWGKFTALPASDLALYWALPTQGAPQRWTKSNSPLVGPKQQVTIKVGVPGTQRFATLLPQIDPRIQVSYSSPGTNGP